MQWRGMVKTLHVRWEGRRWVERVLSSNISLKISKFGCSTCYVINTHMWQQFCGMNDYCDVRGSIYLKIKSWWCGTRSIALATLCHTITTCPTFVIFLMKGQLPHKPISGRLSGCKSDSIDCQCPVASVIRFWQCWVIRGVLMSMSIIWMAPHYWGKVICTVRWALLIITFYWCG